MLKSRKATTRATKTKKFRHSCRHHSILLTSFATTAIAINLLPVVNPCCTQLLFVAAAVFVFAQGPQLPPPTSSFVISMPPSPVLLARHYASRADGAHRHQLQTALVRKLKNEGVIQHEKVMQVMQLVDRANYVSGSYSSYPYDDSPQSIACGQTISAPHMHGYALEYILSALERPSPPRGEAEHEGAGSSDASSGAVVQQQEEEPTIATKVLDVGCGSGYLTAALGRWVHPHDGTSEPRILSKPGKVYGYVL
jgi:Protein-L-isoaspartate(D-aspartate) O-methyltransferase (PCMT)